MHTQTAHEPQTNSSRTTEAWNSITASGKCVLSLGSNETLFNDGDEADFIYEVLDGVLNTYSILVDGRRQITGFHYPGDIIGLNHDGRHHCSCSAIGKARVRSIPRSRLMRLAQDKSEISSRLFDSAASQLAEMQRHFVLLGRKSAQEKMASFILGLARKYGPENGDTISLSIPMTRADIADYLGLTIETVSRTLTKLRVAGVIDIPRSSQIVVLSMQKLHDMAEADNDTV